MKHLFLLLLASTLLLFTACENIQKPTFQKLRNVKVKDITSTEVILTADAILHNPNPLGLTLAGTNIDIFIEGEKMGKAEQTAKSSIPAQNDFTVPIIAKIPLKAFKKDLLGTALSILGSKKMDVQYKGTVTLEALDIEVDVPIDETEKVKIAL